MNQLSKEEGTLEAAKAAISTVLSIDPSVDRKSASEWLDSLKNSVLAWEICDQLLLAREDVKVSYLAAHMLRHKISKNFNELPLECYSSLKNSILNHLQNHDDYAVQGQLTMAIADLTILLQVWQNPIEDLAEQLRLGSTITNTIACDDYMAINKALNNRLIFAYIMHQMCDLNHNDSERPVRIGAKRREEYEDYLISKCSQAITWWIDTFKDIQELKSRLPIGTTANLNQTTLDPNLAETNNKSLETHNNIDKLTGQIFLCYSAWLRIFDEENVTESIPLVDAAFTYLKDLNCSDSVHTYAVEVIVATAIYCEDNRQVDYLINYLVTQIYNLEPAFRQSVANEDLEKSSNFTRVFTSVAETACLLHVIENKDFRIVELLLSCLSHHDFEVVQRTYAFWWMLLEHLQNKLKREEYGPYIVYINRFLVAVIKLCQFDPDEDGVVSRDQDIHAFRDDTSELIMNLMYVTSVEDFLRDNQILDNFRLDLSQIAWEKNEALLYLLSCLVQLTTRDENHIRNQIFSCLIAQQTKIQDLQSLVSAKQLPICIGLASGEVHPQTVATSLRIIGSLENFLADYPDLLTIAINYIMTAITNQNYGSQLIKHSAAALSNIMEVNARLHFSNCHELVVMMKQLCINLDHYEPEAAHDLLKCGTHVAAALKDLYIKDQFLCELIRPSLNSLSNILSRPSKSEDKEMTKYLDYMAEVFRQIELEPTTIPEMKNLTAIVDSELWPMIVKVLEVYASSSSHSIERACRTIRYIIRSLKPEWMIQRVADTMVNLYKSYPHNSSPLYICSILVDEFANRSPEINQGLFNMLEIFCTLTFTLLNMNASQRQSLLTMKSYPETIDDMMRLFKRFMQKCPKEFVTCKAFGSIIDLSISSLHLDHPHSVANVSSFVTSFIKLAESPDYSMISTVIKNVLGARYTDAVVKACLFDLPTSLIGDEAEILMTLYNFDKDLYITWLNATVNSLPTTNVQGIVSVGADQIEEFRNTITTADSLKRIVNCLRAFARLYY